MINHLFDAFRARMPAPDRLLMEADDGRSMSYGDMLTRSAQLAHALVQAGVKPGDRVAVQVEKSPEAALLYLACVRAGAVFLPLNTAYTLPELDYFFRDAEPQLVVCDPERAADIDPLAASAGAATLTLGHDGRGTLADRAETQPTNFDNVARGPDDLAAILYTSGTTGRSKGAMLSHENLASNARVLVEQWRFGADDVLIHALPIFHTHGLFVATNVLLMAGAKMLFEQKFDPGRIISLLPRATVLMGVPTFYVRLLQQPGLTQDATKAMRLFISGSAPLLAETHKAWRKRTGHAILERYGMTETNMNTSNPYDGERRAGTVGFPLPGVSLRITEPETGSPLAQGAIGMIEVKGPNVFAGYWRMPGKTKAEFRGDGFFITGDLGLIDADGYVHIVGRGKDLIISGGYNIYPKEVESEIDALDGVSESAVIGVAHPDFGEGVTAVVVRKPGSAVSAADISGAIAGRLAKYKHPKRVIFVDELPRNTMGKVQKNVLRETYKDIYAAVKAG
ncbi:MULTISPECIES: malonyl-CoA synthase [unclassified Mesorhizobium]|uniref:malonate--CoA ligase n=1 Tax=unclassified Mesorhizobium TaxID=325217 RepID=UPI000BAF00B0|nr:MULTISPECIES: malonyl-CoA synthase [unclassified Mesorhizobium]TGT60702.1 malonyl-CoA synthase [Mesorhizobium sp. M00.F.Ca.ET.170.01.1.1]AZO10199.1 malonyl-CoA synthase [Mesorhizobium sp. M3A.F.Ca.ET.080.04.2.1]PBB87736.1 malonyl-CoA synthase [Mesorhizobium sp. WSM3876]RWB73804.1 MAG: malonyl-CoA synthase [Mesorhizobium sp.]RWB91638.1 MAG: malonyl-CoA synthase [Mesorhizobium sp.]